MPPEAAASSSSAAAGVSSYLRETTVHGFRYLVEGAAASPLERAFWVAAVAASFSVAGVLASFNLCV